MFCVTLSLRAANHLSLDQAYSKEFEFRYNLFADNIRTTDTKMYMYIRDLLYNNVATKKVYSILFVAINFRVCIYFPENHVGT